MESIESKPSRGRLYAEAVKRSNSKTNLRQRQRSSSNFRRVIVSKTNLQETNKRSMVQQLDNRTNELNNFLQGQC